MVNILDLKQLRAVLDNKLNIPVNIGGIVYNMEARRLSAGERAIISDIERRPIPPAIPNKPGSWDYDAPAYRDQVLKARRVGRAVAIYMACSWVSAGNPGLMKHEEILEFVDKSLTENIQEALWAGILVEDMRVVDAANFTSPSGPEQT